MIKPYYEENGITIYHGDCREILPELGNVDAVLTDPPYPNYDYPWPFVPLDSLGLNLKGFYFWPANTVFPLHYDAVHIWSKCNVLVGDTEPYEVIYQIGGTGFCGVFRQAVINCNMNATMNGDVYYPHPTQKPIKLMRRLVKRTKGIIIDPFMGSGTTLVAAKQLGRVAIGIEICEDYCKMAVERLAQGVLDFAS